VGNSVIQESNSNIGLGVTPSAWSLGTTLQIGSTFGTINYSGISAILGIVNAFYNGSSYIRQNTGTVFSLEYNISVGNALAWRMGTDDSTGTTTSLTPVMALFNNGNLFIGTSPNDAGFKLDVNGTGRFSGQITALNGVFGNSGGGNNVISISNNDQSNVRIRITNTGSGGRTYSLVGGLNAVNNSSFSIFDETASSTRMTITSGGDVGIGTTTLNTARLEVTGPIPTFFTADSAANSLTYGGSIFYRNHTGVGQGNGISFALNNVSNSTVEYAYIGGVIESNTAGNVQSGAIIFCPTSNGDRLERVRITSDGYLRMASGTGGIQFNGDTAAANALDDYEEGTWTPTWSSGGGTLNTNTTFTIGRYTKIGNVVHLWARLYTNSVSSPTGEVTVSGLPFTVTNTPTNQPMHLFTMNAINSTLTGTPVIFFQIGTSTATILNKIWNSTEFSGDIANYFDNDTWGYFHASYTV
jgi:hypothetical protein